MTNLIIERDRADYARSRGATKSVRVDEPLGIDLELPASYARDLLGALKNAIASDDAFETAQILVDLPVRLHLRPLQIEQLIERLTEILR